MDTPTEHISRGITDELLRRHRVDHAPAVALPPAAAQLCSDVADQVLADMPDLFDRMALTPPASADPIGAGR